MGVNRCKVGACVEEALHTMASLAPAESKLPRKQATWGRLWYGQEQDETSRPKPPSQPDIGALGLVPLRHVSVTGRYRHREWLFAVGGAVVGIGGLVGVITYVARRSLHSKRPWVRTSRRARTAQIAWLGTRVGRVQVSARAQRIFANAARKEELDRSAEMRTAEQVAQTLGSMKGVMMKLGQMASYLDEGLPEAYRDAMASLQADAPPMAPELAAGVVKSELGGPPEEVFSRWDPVPIAAASIGQVHRAITSDGMAVAVKLQYPGVAEAMAADLENTDLIARSLRLLFPSLEPAEMIQELRARLSEEIDYTIEAQNQALFVARYRGHPFIHVPQLRPDLSTSKVLTMELAAGARLDEVATWTKEERDLAGEAIFRFVFRSLYRMHVFNGDPHPGNYLFRPSGHVTFLDYGLVKRFTPEEVEVFERMLRAAVLEPDAKAFRALLEEVGILARNAPVDTEDVFRFYGRFYDMVTQPGRREVTPEFASRMARLVFDVGDPVARYCNVPSMFVVVQRINLGLYAVLARLRAEADWRRIAEELWPIVDAPPSTPLGEAEAEWIRGGGGTP